MTGGSLQWYNGIILLLTFFCSRLVWGTWQSVCVFRDIWAIMQTTVPTVRDLHSSPGSSIFVPRDGQLCMGKESCVVAQSEVMKFATAEGALSVPFWLAMTYLGSNLILHSLNFYWFGKMIETIRKRFEGKEHDEYKHERERRVSLVEELASGLDEDEISGPKTPAAEKSEAAATGSSVNEKKTEVNKRKK